MDLELAAYKQGKPFAVFNAGPQPIPRRRPMMFKPLIDSTATDLDKIVKRLRYSSWRRQENHNKQLQMFLNRERYQQNQTWQAEHDRLLSEQAMAPGLQQQVNERLGVLKNLLIS